MGVGGSGKNAVGVGVDPGGASTSRIWATGNTWEGAAPPIEGAPQLVIRLARTKTGMMRFKRSILWSDSAEVVCNGFEDRSDYTFILLTKPSGLSGNFRRITGEAFPIEPPGEIRRASHLHPAQRRK